MKLLLALLVVFMAVLLQGTKPTASEGLECYSCGQHRSCKKKFSIICKPEEDTCSKTSIKMSDTSDPDPDNEYSPTMDVYVSERRCMTAEQCRNTRRNRITTMTCCNTDLCNA